MIDYEAEALKLRTYILQQYSHLLESDADFQISIYNGYTKYAKPLDLSLLCHPANFKHFAKPSIAGLKKRVAKFDKKHGCPVFPTNTSFVRKQETVPAEGLRVLGLDPGTKNFGVFGGVLMGNNLTGIQPLITKMFRRPVLSLAADLQTHYNKFCIEFIDLLDQVQPNIVVAERFQARGLAGPTVELVSFMLGIMAKICAERQIKFMPVIAGQWKNAVNKKTSLDDMYASLSPKHYHRLDAMLMSLYAHPDKNVYAYLTANRIEKIINYIRNEDGLR